MKDIRFQPGLIVATRNTDEIEDEHNPEVAGSNPAPATTQVA